MTKQRRCNQQEEEERGNAVAIATGGGDDQVRQSLESSLAHHIVPEFDHHSSASTEVLRPRSLLEGSESAQVCRYRMDAPSSAAFKSEEKLSSCHKSRRGGGVKQQGETSLLSCGEAIEQQKIDTPAAASLAAPTKEPLPPGVIDIDDIEVSE